MKTRRDLALLLNVEADDSMTNADVAGVIVRELPNWNLGGDDTPQVAIIGATVDLGGQGDHLAHPGSITESWRNRTRLDT